MCRARLNGKNTCDQKEVLIVNKDISRLANWGRKRTNNLYTRSIMYSASYEGRALTWDFISTSENLVFAVADSSFAEIQYTRKLYIP